jgi:arylsulfatase A-like enzyme
VQHRSGPSFAILTRVPKRYLDGRWPWLAAAAVIVLAFLSTVVEVRIPGEADRRPRGSADDIARLRERTDTNVLFVLIDTLRADRLGAYGYERDTSPALDRVASTGVRFARHLAQSSWTKCSMASLWTGLYPARSGITRFDEVIPGEGRLPAEILKEAGFRTVGLYRNGWVAANFGFDQGFDVYTRPAPRPLPPTVRAENPTLAVRGTDEDTLATALEFLRVEGRERWFLYLHLMDVHEYLYDEESALFGATYSDIYDNSIRWTDHVIGALMANLRDQGYAENTLIAISADHGEAFRERGFEAHAREVYKETTEVPFLLAFPFRLEPGVVVDVRTRNVDVWPTLLDLIGLESPPGIDGRSLVPEILAAARGEPSPGGDRTAVAHIDQHWGQRERSPRPMVAIAEGSLRYVRVAPPRDGAVMEQLFDAASDPRELEDLAPEHPEALAPLRALADAYLSTQPPWADRPTQEIDELELNQLRALGYAVPGER